MSDQNYKIDNKVLIEICNGFIRALKNGLKQMANVDANRVGIYLKKPNQTMKGDLSSMVSIFGELQGTCVITFPKKTAIYLIQQLLMDDSIDDVGEEVQDGIGEIANLAAGGAKSELSAILETESHITTPQVITGIGHFVEHNKKLPCIGCVFEANGHKFAMEISIYLNKNME